MSFGVAIASLATALFVGTEHPDPSTMVTGIHRTFVTLGIATVLAAGVFLQLRPGDGSSVSRAEE